MSLSADLEALFAEDDETIINDPLRFKAKLGIGERAFGLLRAREHMATFTEAMGVGGTASAAVGSSVVASTFFAPTGILASLGLGAAAATPIGWVIAAGVVSSAAYFGVSRFFERSKDSHLIVIPKYINTPMDMIAIALLELMLPVSIKVAKSDGEICDRERTALHDYYVDQWGYNPRFLDRMIEDYEENIDKVSFAALANSLEEYCQTNPDCNPEIILESFQTHVAEVTEANGSINESEREQLLYLNQLMTQAANKSQLSDVLDTAKSGLGKGYEATTGFASSTAKQIGQAIKTSSNKASPYADRATETAAKGLSKAVDIANKLGGKLPASSSKARSLFQKRQSSTEDK